MARPSDINTDALKARIREALQRRAGNVTNRDSWRLRMADELGMHPDTFKAYLYGETCPGLEAWLRLCVHFGADFKNEIEEGAGFVSARTEDDAAAAVLTAIALKNIRKVPAVLRAVADEIEEQAEGAKPRAVEEAT